MMNPDSWIVALLNSKNLARPDGRMLYGYRLTDEEFRSLRETLSFATSFGKLDDVSNRIRGFSALFVLYAAEWWRREYQGGAWRWSPIIRTFQDNAEEFDAAARTKCVISGFAFWGHRPSGDGKKFFGSVVAHGGLPLNFIAHGGGKFASIMEHTLRLASRYGWDESQITQAVAERGDELAKDLRRIEIYELISRMIATVLEIKQEFRLSGVVDPISLLNEQDSGWRQRFPLPLDDEAAQVLLYGLVKEAAQQVTTSSSAIFSVERLLRKVADERYELLSSLLCPKTIETDALVNVFGIGAADMLPRYFNIDAQVITRTPVADGRQISGAQTPSVSLSLRKQVWKDMEACAEHTLILSGPHGDLRDSPISVPGGSELSQDEPWIFVFRDGKNTLVATGGARIPEDEALVALPEGWAINATDNGSSVAAGVCGLGERQMPLCLVCGVVDLVNGDQKYRVRTQQATGNPDSYAWEGRRILFPSTPPAIYFGVPKLYRYTAEGERSRVTRAELEWFIAGTNTRIEDLNTARGPVDVYLTRDGERLARFRLVIIDSSAQTRFFSGEASSDGRICLEGWGCSNISVSDTPGLNTVISQVGTGFEVQMSAGVLPPEAVTIDMYWARCARDVRLRLPFPCSGGRFFDADGNPLRDGCTLTLQHLTGARLRVFDRNPQQPKRYEVIMTLRGSQLKESKAVELKKDGSAEIRLIDLQKNIETLMGFSDNLDAVVDAALSVGGSRTSSISLSRYECNLEHQPGGVGISSDVVEKMDTDRLQNVRVHATPMTSMNSDGILLEQALSEGAPTGFWDVDALDPAKSPWLIFPDETSSVYFRPTVWATIDPEADSDATKTGGCLLASAMMVSNKLERDALITDVLDEMAHDFNHDSWALLDHLWTEFHHLPLCSLDVFRILGTKPEVAVSMMLRSQLPEEELFAFSRQLRDELGLVWELTTIPMWRDAVKSFWRYWLVLLKMEVDAAKPIFDIVLGNRLHGLSQSVPSLKLPLDFVVYEATGKKSEELENLWNAAERDQLFAARHLWGGGDSLGNTLLFLAHAQDTWPEKENSKTFFESALGGFDNAADKHTKNIIGPIAQLLFWIRPGDFKQPVANAPVLCALWAATGAGQEWWSLPERRLALRKLRAFDPIWFEQAFRQAMAACLALHELVEPTQLINEDGAV